MIKELFKETFNTSREELRYVGKLILFGGTGALIGAGVSYLSGNPGEIVEYSAAGDLVGNTFYLTGIVGGIFEGHDQDNSIYNKIFF